MAVIVRTPAADSPDHTMQDVEINGTWWEVSTGGKLIVFKGNDDGDRVAEFAPGSWTFARKAAE